LGIALFAWRRVCGIVEKGAPQSFRIRRDPEGPTDLAFVEVHLEGVGEGDFIHFLREPLGRPNRQAADPLKIAKVSETPHDQVGDL
jgi:hypothetical protein